MEFDCGCDNRREVMGAGDWQTDAYVIVAAVIVFIIVVVIVQ